ncbi:Asr1405/Asl0597 family protein [Myxosarcina sp. GI1]|uniref:Asr1405/Asl0597 family protein n=1 Tax=Myxosarcina sp. GI1 TaxID=1541065 RepID=UPI00068C2706|nr:Asr1405/Asl0597 family protein [Myxosarcina sp. GI1]
MQKPFDQKFHFRRLGKTTFFALQRGENINLIVHQWHTALIKLRQKYDRGSAKRNWLEGLTAKPGCCSLLFSQFVCWLERKQIPLLPRFLAFLWWFFTNFDIFPEHKIGKEGKDNECSSTFANVIVVPIVEISDYAKQIAYQRLQELDIPCWRTRDGNIWVEVKDVNIAILVHQTIQQSTAKTPELVQMLHNCWNQDIAS